IDTRRESDSAPGRKKKLSDVGAAAYFVAILAAGFSIVPVLYIMYSAFRTNGQLSASPAGWPDPFVWSNYSQIIGDSAFWQMMFASTIIALATTIGVVLLGVMAAYPLARYDFPGREGLYTYFTAGLLFPITVAAL